MYLSSIDCYDLMSSPTRKESPDLCSNEIRQERNIASRPDRGDSNDADLDLQAQDSSHRRSQSSQLASVASSFSINSVSGNSSQNQSVTRLPQDHVLPPPSSRHAEGALLIDQNRRLGAQSMMTSIANIVASPSGSPRSTTSAFLLGMLKNPEELDSVDLAKFVRENQTTLSFPEKVRRFST